MPSRIGYSLGDLALAPLYPYSRSGRYVTHTTDARSFWKGLLKSFLIATTVSSGASVAASDLRAGEPAQLSSDSPAAEVRSFSRRAVVTRPLTIRRMGEPEFSDRQDLEAATIPSEDESEPHDDSEFRTARSSFGAGSFAISALGYNASN